MIDHIGRYEVVGRIAVGVGHELMLGREASGRPVAIRRIPPGVGRGSTAIHPNLVETIEIVQVEDAFYLVMEYLEGENLAALIRRLVKRRERIPYGLAAYIIAEVCDGLHAAHMAGELHRAVSPENVFITYGGDVKLLELGLAAIDPDSPYRSPEQTAGRPLGRQSDVYSLGLVMYELTTLHRLFAIPGADRSIPAPRTQVTNYPPALEPICLRAVEPDAAARYRSALEMRDALLDVARMLNLDDDPSQSLASKLMRLFGERVASKRELLDRVRVGVPIGDLVPTAVDEEIDVPSVVRPLAEFAESIEPMYRARVPSEPSAPEPAQPVAALKPAPITKQKGSPDRAPPAEAADTVKSPAVPMEHVDRGFRWGVALLFVLALGAGGAAGGWLRLNESAGGVPAISEPGEAASAGERRLWEIDAGTDRDAAALAPVAPSGDGGLVPALVTISITTEPAGARVTVDGDDNGVTPVDLRISGGPKALRIELTRDGYASKQLDVIPDRDRALRERLRSLSRRDGR